MAEIQIALVGIANKIALLGELCACLIKRGLVVPIIIFKKKVSTILLTHN